MIDPKILAAIEQERWDSIREWETVTLNSSERLIVFHYRTLTYTDQTKYFERMFGTEAASTQHRITRKRDSNVVAVEFGGAS